jgi:hypothetical protein
MDLSRSLKLSVTLLPVKTWWRLTVYPAYQTKFIRTKPDF